MIITEIKSMWPEKKGFGFIRRSTGNQYIFLHFLSPVIIETMGKSIRVNPGGCIIYEKFSYQRLSSPECALTHNWFHLKGDLTEISNRYGIEFGKVYYPENDEHITTIIQNMEIEFMNKKSHWEDICRLGCEEIFARMTRAEQKSESPINRIKKKPLCLSAQGYILNILRIQALNKWQKRQACLFRDFTLTIANFLEHLPEKTLSTQELSMQKEC